MTIPEILKELEFYNGKFPKAALDAAIEQREAMIPELLGVLERVAEDPAKWASDLDYTLHSFAMFLLAQFRERRAYPLIVKILNAPDDLSDELLADTEIDSTAQILGSVYDGNPESLQKVVENPKLSDLAREVALQTFLVLENTGQLSRDELIKYLKHLFEGGLERVPTFVWDALISAVADLSATDLLDHVRQAYTEGLVDSGFMPLAKIEREIASPSPHRRLSHRLIEDIFKELKDRELSDDDELDWPMDPDLEDPDLEPESEDFNRDYAPPQPYVREAPKVGRNDPCPCGSGKKYKKCCGK